MGQCAINRAAKLKIFFNSEHHEANLTDKS